MPEADQYLLLSYSFDDLSLTEEHTVLASIRMFIDSGLLQNFRMDTKVCTPTDVKVNSKLLTYRNNWIISVCANGSTAELCALIL